MTNLLFVSRENQHTILKNSEAFDVIGITQSELPLFATSLIQIHQVDFQMKEVEIVIVFHKTNTQSKIELHTTQAVYFYGR